MPFTAFHHNIAKKISVVAVAVCYCVFLSSFAHSESLCTSISFDTQAYNDSWGRKKIVKIDGDHNYYTHCGGNTGDDNRLRVSYKCSDSTDCVSSTYYFAKVLNNWHVERHYNESCDFACVANLQRCSYFPNYFSSGSVLAGYKENEGDFDFNNSALESDPCEAMTCSYTVSFNAVDTNCGYSPTSELCTYGWKVNNPNDSNACRLQKSGLSNASKHCTSGTVVWKANEYLYGNVTTGFALNFNKYNTDRISYTCQICEIGWKPDSNGVCGCDTANGFVGYGRSYCGCKKGYKYDGSTCVQNTDPSAHFSSVSDPVRDGYYCETRYKESWSTPSSSNNYQHYNCECNTDNGFIEDTEGCHCQTGYTINNMGDNNPENDTCVIDTGAEYEDSTGWFKVGSNGSSCSGNWWEQQN